MAFYSFNMNSGSRQGGNPLGGFGCLLTALVFFGTVYFIFNALYSQWWVAAGLLLLALAINWKVVAGIGQGLVGVLRRNVLSGLFLVGLCVVGFPIVCLLMVFAALAGNRVTAFQRDFETRMREGMGGFEGVFNAPPAPPKDDEYIDYEVIESEPKFSSKKEEIDPLELPEPPLKKPKQKEEKNPYEDLMD